ncbi:MAG TPA: hypothetical protein VLF61_00995 [Rhabdochlamydiaceae bacterium]|nr:hypothetical protein [Rhabdochlamydiaceae bacterium]
MRKSETESEFGQILAFSQVRSSKLTWKKVSENENAAKSQKMAEIALLMIFSQPQGQKIWRTAIL